MSTVTKVSLGFPKPESAVKVPAAPPSKKAEAAHLDQSELLEFYKQRCEEFDSERKELLDALDRVKVDTKELYRLQVESKTRMQEVRDLQRALSDAHVMLFDERQKLLALQAQNDELRIQEAEDRKRIQHLLAVTQPAGPETTHFIDRDGPGGAMAAAAGGDDRDVAQWEQGRRSRFRPYPGEGVSVDSLLLQIKSLKAQLSEHKTFAHERIAALLEDRRVAEVDADAQAGALRAALDHALERQGGLQEALEATTRDYIKARQVKHAAEKELVETREALTRAVEEARAEAEATKRRGREEMALFKEACEGRVREFSDGMRKQLKEKEHSMRQVETMHDAVRVAYEGRIAELEGRVRDLKAALRRSEQRRVMDMEGFQSEVSLLRRSLMSLGIRVTQMHLMDRLENDDRLDRLVAQLDRAAPAVPGGALMPRGGGGEDAGPAGLLQSAEQLDINAVRGALDKLEARVQRKREEIAERTRKIGTKVVDGDGAEPGKA